MKRLIEQRDGQRRQDPSDPALPELNQRIASSISASSRKRWLEEVGRSDRKLDPQRFWGLLKGLSGKRTSQAPNQPIQFGDAIFTKKDQIAKQFCRHINRLKSRELFFEIIK